ncbi:MAG: hypothetical protein Q9186_006548 [Xanthomendoza sp. 1 TL-2023]
MVLYFANENKLLGDERLPRQATKNDKENFITEKRDRQLISKATVLSTLRTVFSELASLLDNN